MNNIDQVVNSRCELITLKQGQKFKLGNTVYYFIKGSDDEWSLIKDE